MSNTSVLNCLCFLSEFFTESRLEKGRYHQVYKGKDKQWHFADSGMKDRSQDVSITLPRGREHYRSD